MARNRVRIAGARNQTVRIPNGTGLVAVLGTNVYDAEGNLLHDADVLNAYDNDSAQGGSQTGISLDDVQVIGDGVTAVAGSLAQGAVRVGIDLARAWVFS